MAILQDSGERREFETGAVRDLAEGKGRCDLLPLVTVATLLSLTYGSGAGVPITHIDTFMKTGETRYLHMVLEQFHKADIIQGILDASKQYEDGMQKYGERNWEKGLPAHTYVSSAIRHYLKWLRGDTDEPHDRAFTWNILCLIHTVLFIPGMNDLPFAKPKPKRSAFEDAIVLDILEAEV